MACNKTGQYQPYLINLPDGAYTNLNDAINDVSGYNVDALPDAYTLNSTTGLSLYRLTFRITSAGGGTWTLHNTEDLRQTNNVGGGASITPQQTFSDAEFAIFNTTDPTKIMDFDASGITTATTRTLAIPDEDGTIITNQGGTFVGNVTIDGSADEIQLIVQANATQTANLQEWQNSSGEEGVVISPDAKEIQLYDSGASNYVGFKAPALTVNQTYTLPIIDGSSGDILRTDGAGVLSWVAPSAGSSPLTTKGDIFGYDTGDARIPVGNDGEVLIADSSAALGVAWGNAAVPAPPGARLSLSSSESVPSSDVTAATTLYLIPHNGGRNFTYYDTGASAWAEMELPATPASLSVAALTANTLYDVFGYNNSGTLTLETVSWGTNTAYNISSISIANFGVVTYSHTSQAFAVGDTIAIQGVTGTVNTKVHTVTTVLAIATVSAGVSYSVTLGISTTGLAYTSGGTIRLFKNTRTTALATQDNYKVQSGATNKLFLGKILINGDGGAVNDTEAERHITNQYNLEERRLRMVASGISAGYSIASTSTTWKYPAIVDTFYNGDGRVGFLGHEDGRAIVQMIWATGITLTAANLAMLLGLEQNKITETVTSLNHDAAFGHPGTSFQPAFSHHDNLPDNAGFNYMQKLLAITSGQTGSVWVGAGTLFQLDTTGTIMA
jgi:hypothetical protein